MENHVPYYHLSNTCKSMTEGMARSVEGRRLISFMMLASRTGTSFFRKWNESGSVAVLPNSTSCCIVSGEGLYRDSESMCCIAFKMGSSELRVLPRDDSGYGLTGYGSYGIVTSYKILTVYYCDRNNLALFNRY